MLPAPLAELEASEAVSPAGLGQNSLVAELLPWRAPAFLADLLDLRREIDATLRAAAPGPLPATYPAGACRPIRNQGLARLRSWPAADNSRPALQSLARFRDRGGIVKGIWGIQKGVYFQNAIQAGDLWVDLANDTVDLTRPPVEVCQLGEARFEEVESFERFAEVARIYWAAEAYPNHILPAVAAVLPVILVFADGRARLATPTTLLPRNIRLDFTLAEAFLRRSPWAARSLPGPLLERLEQDAREGSGWFAAAGSWGSPLATAAGPGDAGSVIDAELKRWRQPDETTATRRFYEIVRVASTPLLAPAGEMPVG